MDVLSTESLEKLRSSCMKNPDVIHQEFEELEDEFNLTTVPFNAEIANFPSLEISGRNITRDKQRSGKLQDTSRSFL